MKNATNFKLRKILNDLKRRPEDAARDLGVSEEKIKNILSNNESLDLGLIEKAVKVWPVNYADFFGTEDDAENGYKIFKSFDSNISERIMHRDNKPYYAYKDTVMSKVSSFRPELIQELSIVEDANPDNENAKFNNGHFLHQFTYFIGPVNFYYMKDGKKQIAEMNTGDSMYISPYVPHTFTTRKNNKNKLGCILALTYADKIDGESINELSAIGYNLAKKFKLDLKHKESGFVENLKYHLNAASISSDNLKKETGLDISELKKNIEMPKFEIIEKISIYLNINVRELIPPRKNEEVKIRKYDDNRKWNYPSDNNKVYKFLELTNLEQLPLSKAYELEILSEEDHTIELEVPCHQYIYNIDERKCIIKINDEYKEIFEPGDSIYLKPYVKHKFYNHCKLLILRIGGKISGDVLYQFSMISQNNIKRLINDNKPWFD